MTKSIKTKCGHCGHINYSKDIIVKCANCEIVGGHMRGAIE